VDIENANSIRKWDEFERKGLSKIAVRIFSEEVYKQWHELLIELKGKSNEK
jgi:hypothetical protein